VAAIVFDETTNATIVLALALAIPLANIVGIFFLARYPQGNASPVNFNGMVRNVFLNPIILSTVAGLLINISGLTPWTPLLVSVNALGKSSLGLGLIGVGGGIVFSLKRSYVSGALLSTVLKLLIFPVCTYFLGIGILAHKEQILALTFVAALPVASNSYVLTRKLGGNGELMAAIILLQTIASILTLPISVYCMSSLHLT